MGDPAQPTPQGDFTASRQSTGDSSFSALTPSYEERLIILAQGKTFQNQDIADDAIPDYLQTRLSNLVVTDDRNMTYADDVQHVNFTIQRVTTKSDFVQALQTAGAHVVYCGHSRYGQGPCFGDTKDPGEEWGHHSADPTNTGVFSSGFPYIGLPIDEIADEHQYTVDPVSGGDDKPAASDCHPHAARVYGSMKQFSLADLQAPPAPLSQVQASADSVAALLGNPGSDATFWGYDATGESGKQERHVLCSCGWDDMQGVAMTCKAYICIACSTFIHFYPIVRKLKGWKKDGDNNLAYWTTNVTASSEMTKFWLYRILSYPKRNDFSPWEPSLEWAKQMANRDYAGSGAPYPASLI
jgi:hypothetical protein